MGEEKAANLRQSAPSPLTQPNAIEKKKNIDIDHGTLQRHFNQVRVVADKILMRMMVSVVHHDSVLKTGTGQRITQKASGR